MCQNNTTIIIRDHNASISKEGKMRTWICEISIISRSTHMRK